MAKIVYNACYGGFSLSRAAVLRAREISGDPQWGGPCIVGDTFSDGSHVSSDSMAFPEVSRTDATLVRVVEEMGKAANGECAAIRIEEVPSGTQYRIEEYDGSERIMTASDYEWQTA